MVHGTLKEIKLKKVVGSVGIFKVRRSLKMIGVNLLIDLFNKIGGET